MLLEITWNHMRNGCFSEFPFSVFLTDQGATLSLILESLDVAAHLFFLKRADFRQPSSLIARL